MDGDSRHFFTVVWNWEKLEEDQWEISVEEDSVLIHVGGAPFSWILSTMTTNDNLGKRVTRYEKRYKIDRELKWGIGSSLIEAEATVGLPLQVSSSKCALIMRDYM